MTRRARPAGEPSRASRAFPIMALLALTGCWADFPEEYMKLPDSGPPYPRRYDLALPARPDSYQPGLDRGALPGNPDQLARDAQVSDLLKCTASATISCTPDHKGILKCSPSGFGTEVVDCSPATCQEPGYICNACDPAAPPTCDKNALVTCTPDGLPRTTPCPKACKNGACM